MTELRWWVLDDPSVLDAAEQIAFGRRFGEVTPAHPTLPAAIPEHPEILVLDSHEAQALGGTEIASLWHTDVTFVPNPPMGVILGREQKDWIQPGDEYRVEIEGLGLLSNTVVSG